MEKGEEHKTSPKSGYLVVLTVRSSDLTLTKFAISNRVDVERHQDLHRSLVLLLLPLLLLLLLLMLLLLGRALS